MSYHPGAMTQSGYLFLGLTAVVAALAAVLAYAVLRFIVAARNMAKGGQGSGGEAVFVTTAMEDALARPAVAGARHEGAGRGVGTAER